MSVPVPPPPAPMAGPQRARPRGRRVIRAGIAIMIVAALAIAASVASWFLFGKTSTDGAELFSMPGSVSADLTEGEWALYSEEIDGSQKVARSDDVTIDGPGEVTAENTYGFYADSTTIDFEGTTYTVFVKLDVPEDGTYDIDVAYDNSDGDVPIVLGQYPDHDVLGAAVVYTVVVSMLLGTVGLIVLIVGLVMWVTGRKKTPPLMPPPPPPPMGPPTTYPTA